MVEDAFHYVLKAKDKLKRRHQGSSQGKKKQDHLVKDKMSVEDEPKPIESRKRMGKASFKGKCFHHGEGGLIYYECS